MPGLTPKELESMFTMANISGNGQLTLKEFTNQIQMPSQFSRRIHLMDDYGGEYE